MKIKRRKKLAKAIKEVSKEDEEYPPVEAIDKNKLQKTLLIYLAELVKRINIINNGKLELFKQETSNLQILTNEIMKLTNEPTQGNNSEANVLFNKEEMIE
jgi:hypothetical protein